MNRVIFGDIENIDISNVAVVTIPENLEKSTDLFDVVKKQIGLPVYFGGNWDAFYDSLCDLSWVPQHTVVFVHKGRTFRDNRTWRMYLDVLRDCIKDWREGEEHQVVAVFPEKLREELTKILDLDSDNQSDD